MIRRFVRIAAAFLATLVAYSAYALVVVPRVEPPDIELEGVAAPSEEDINAARLGPANQLARLRTWFREGDWELETPKIIETRQGKLLLGNYETRRDGLVFIKPCTVILIPDESNGTEEERNRAAVVLRAPEGALIRFDSELDLARGKVGKPIAGNLEGPITISSGRELPGPEDDLLVVTRDVELENDHISTKSLVEFRLGKNHGSGHGLDIELLRKPGSGKSILDAEGIRLLTLRKQIQAQVELAGGELVPAQFAASPTTRIAPQPPADPPAAGPAPPPAEPTPVVVTCAGPFQYDTTAHTATFHRDVDVVRLYPEGPSDQLSCQRLSIIFERSADQPNPPNAAAAAESSTGGLTARRLEAVGKPIVIEAPQMGVSARGELLRYDLHTGQATLTSQREATISRGTDIVSAGELHYQPDPQGGPPRILAVGAGWIEAAPPDDPTGRIRAAWQEKLEVYAHRGQQVVAVHGAARVTSAGFGQLDSDEIYIFLEPVAQPSVDEEETTKYEPRRMIAQGAVRIQSDQLTAETDTLRAWFVQQPKPQASVQPAAQTRRPDDRIERLPAPARYASNAPPVRAPAPTIALPRPQQPLPSPAAPKTPPTSRYEVTAGELLVELKIGGEQTELSQLMARQDVELDEVPLQATSDEPLRVRGDYVHVDQRTVEDSVAVVHGRPGHIEGRGMTIDGAEIKLFRGQNVLHIDAPGHLSLPPQQASAAPVDNATAASTDDQLDIYWQGHMHFDGMKITFHDQVVAQQQGQQLSTQQMDVYLTRRVDFTNPNRDAKPEIDSIICDQQVVLDRNALDGEGRPTIEHLEALRLKLENASGAIHVQGPGQLRSFRYSADQAFALPAANPNNPQQPPPPADRPPTPKLLDVRFDSHAEGNFRNRQLTLHGRVRTLYGPVRNPNERLDPDRLGPSDVYLTCDELTVLQLAPATAPGADTGPIELVATGNTEVEGEQFTARGHRIRYAQAKDLLVLEGGEYTQAELYRQTSIDVEPQVTRGRRIKYWRGSNQVQMEGVRSLDAVGMVPGDTSR